MRVILANPRGFCAGVNMAIDCVDQVLALRGAPVYVYHEIVHNRHVVSRFEDKGVTFVDDVDEIPVGGVVIYSAHGISPTIRQAAKTRNLIEVDATCPLVTKVHMEVIRYAREGYTVLFIGHHNHDEAIGTVGEAPSSVIIVESPEEVERLSFPAGKKLAFVTQTTLSVSEASRTIAALKAKFPDIRYPAKEDICYATTNRQAAVTDLAAQADVVLVVGSQNSSNSKRLVETAKERGKPGYLIDDETELDPAWLAGASTVMVTAGASAPDDLVQALLERLREEFGGVVETYTLVEEDVSFDLPKSVKRLLVLN